MNTGAKTGLKASALDYRIVQLPKKGGFVVVSRTNGPIEAGPYREKVLAEAAVDKLAGRKALVDRACMCCLKSFKSSGIGHRLCNDCKYRYSA